MGRRKASGTCEIIDDGGTEVDDVLAVESAFVEADVIPTGSSSGVGDGFAVYSVRAKVDRLGVWGVVMPADSFLGVVGSDILLLNENPEVLVVIENLVMVCSVSLVLKSNKQSINVTQSARAVFQVTCQNSNY